MAENHDVGGRPSPSDFYYDPHCEGCQEDGRNVEAVGFCDECGVFMCKNCRQVHSRLPSTRDHIIQTGKDMPESMTEKPVRYPRCDKYVVQVNDRFCTDHHQLVCSKCQSKEHAACEITTVDEACRIYDNVKFRKTVDKQCKSIEQKVAIAKAKLQSNIKQIDKRKHDISAEAKNIFDKTVSKLRKLLKSIEDDIDKVSSRETKSLKAQHTTISAAEDIMKSVRNVTNTNSVGNMNPSAFIRLLELTDKFNSQTEELNEIGNLNTINISLKLHKTLEEFLAHELSFGEICVDKTEMELPEV